MELGAFFDQSGRQVTNIQTFNSGWDSNAQKLASFTDVRELQRQLEGARGAVAERCG